jgi:4-hydroxy-4-methyl-2-oxoglutarate aldolase
MAGLGGPGSLADRLAVLDSCACSDAMDQLGISGVAAGLRNLTGTQRVTGPVITVQLGPADSEAASGRHLGTAAIESARPGDVIVVAAGGRTDAASWGGLLSLAAAARGAGGVIVDGACRDVDEIAELGLPIYALSPVPVTARGRQAEVAWNAPIRIAGASVSPGDFVVADGSGVIFLPAGRAAEIVAAAESIAAVQAAMAARIQTGEKASQVMSADYEQMLRRAPGPAGRPDR